MEEISVKKPPEIVDNLYAKLFAQQGSLVIQVDGIDWYDYKGCMIPAFLPHCVPPIDPAMAREVLRRSGRLMARWIHGFGQVESTEWWYVLRKEPWDIDGVDDKKKRWMIRQGRKNFTVRPLTAEDILNQCARVSQLAATRYKGRAEIETQAVFAKRVGIIKNFPEVAEYIGCFLEDQLVGFSENYIQDNAVFLYVIRNDPAFLNKYSGYALLDWMLTHYLNERKMKYVLDGSRTIYHETNIQDHLIKVFGFTREYALLNVVYSPWMKVPLHILHPFKKPIFSLSEKASSNLIKKFSAILNQESIARSCKKIYFAGSAALNGDAKTADSVTIAPIGEETIPGVAYLHMVGIKDSFLGSLGPTLVKYLYQAILKSDRAFGFVAVKNGEVIGFITGTENVGAIYKDVLNKYFFPLVLVFLPKMLKWRNLKNAIETLFYPLKVEHDLPQAEILSVVVSEKARGLGIGRKLMNAALDEFKRRGIAEIKVLVGEWLKANEYYKQMSFELKGEYHHHGYKLNVYTIRVGDK